MHFTDASDGERVSGGYGVYVNNRSMNNKKKVSSCAHEHEGTGMRYPSYAPCPAWQVSLSDFLIIYSECTRQFLG